jgi:hypothetical protein
MFKSNSDFELKYVDFISCLGKHYKIGSMKNKKSIIALICLIGIIDSCQFNGNLFRRRARFV